MSGASYLCRLEALDPRASLLAPAERRLLLLTGQSSFASARLAPEQSAFLAAVAPPGADLHDAGFPFHPAMLGDAPAAGILAASARNFLQVLWSVSSRRYQACVRATLQQALDATRDELLLLTGSCGLQLANRAWPGLVVPARLRVRIVALGPACFGALRLAPVEVTVVRGRGDGWSRLFYRGRIDVEAPCGHLDYWTSSAVREAVAALLAGEGPGATP